MKLPRLRLRAARARISRIALAEVSLASARDMTVLLKHLTGYKVDHEAVIVVQQRLANFRLIELRVCYD